MSKLGYTFYPKDWSSDDAVFELLLDERGLFRELIDLAMLNDNTTKINSSVWCRKFAITKEKLDDILAILSDKELIKIDKNTLFIPSCEKRLKLVRAGRNGGKKSTKNKPNGKPLVKPTHKPLGKQIEKKEKEKVYREFAHLKLSLKDYESLNNDYTKEQIDATLDSIENYKKNTSYTSLNLTARKWLKKEFPNGTTKTFSKPQPRSLN